MRLSTRGPRSKAEPVSDDAGERVPVGWCHQCGTVQLKERMPLASLPWTDGPEPVCIECGDEPWGLGVWDKGQHEARCEWVVAAQTDLIDWEPAFPCHCHPAVDQVADALV